MAQLSGSFRLGALTIHHLSDGSDALPRQSWFHGIDPAEWVAALGLDGPEHVFGRTLGGVFAITGDGHVTLVETGNGVNAKGRATLEGGGELLERLAEIGIGRGDVDRIFQTHLHGDHCGWLVEDDNGALTFPNAIVHLHQKEYEYWTGPAADDNTGNRTARTRITPVAAAGRMQTFDREVAISETMTALPTPGHTPGHSSLLLTSEGQHAIILGDVAHHPIHLERHDWLPQIDLDPAESIRSRAKMAALAVEKDALVTAPHMPIVTLGRVRRRGDGYQYVAVRTPDGWNRERAADE